MSELAQIREDRRLLGWLGVPLAVLAVLQVAMGADPLIVLLSTVGIILSLTPMALLGRDIYTLFCAIVGARYLGFALIFKTLKVQALDSHLNYPVESYVLTAFLMGILAAAVSFGRKLDTGRRGLLPPLTNDSAMRRLANYSFFLGVAGSVVVAATAVRKYGGASGGVIFVLASQVTSLVYLALIAETRRRIAQTGGNGFVSVRLAGMLVILAVAAIFLSVRGYLANGVIAVAATAFLFRAVKLRHVVSGAIALALVGGVISPVILAVREARFSTSSAEFAQRSVALAGAAIVNPELRRELSERTSLQTRYDNGLVAYDYYGDRANVENRLSFVAHMDAVYAGTRTHEPVGFATFGQAIARIIPKALWRNKPAATYQHGDWLSWQMGMSERGRSYAAVFPIPMEGLAAFGILGLILLPISLIIVFRVANILTTFRYPYVWSLFLFASMQHYWIEGTSATYLSMIFRDLAIDGVMLAALMYAAKISGSPGLRSSLGEVQHAQLLRSKSAL